eukprot:TRINITY_DN8355_c1_g1_i1.p1 TRINITY_DN8355_c1_g1~~TRINITY_DN8355_c1_g1_i1.p1  ORF type:complete len:463 (-),score=88.52 TRINITY_DN8355_c1_g1_i1:3-1343(-)
MEHIKRLLDTKGQAWLEKDITATSLFIASHGWLKGSADMSKGQTVQALQQMIAALWMDCRTCDFPTDGSLIPRQVKFIYDHIVAHEESFEKTDTSKMTPEKAKILKRSQSVSKIITSILVAYLKGGTSKHIPRALVHYKEAIDLLQKLEEEEGPLPSDASEVVSAGVFNGEMAPVCNIFPLSSDKKEEYTWIRSAPFLSFVYTLLARTQACNPFTVNDSTSVLETLQFAKQATDLNRRNISAWQFYIGVNIHTGYADKNEDTKKEKYANVRSAFESCKDLLKMGEQYSAMIWYDWLAVLVLDPHAGPLSVGDLRKNSNRAKEYLQAAEPIFGPMKRWSITQVNNALYNTQTLPDEQQLERSAQLTQDIPKSIEKQSLSTTPSSSSSPSSLSTHPAAAAGGGCVVCNSSENLQKCKSCMSVMYCSRDCQVKDWKAGHKQKCKPATTK